MDKFSSMAPWVWRVTRIDCAENWPGRTFDWLDRDEQALIRARKRLSFFEGKLDLVHSNFSDFDEVLDRLGVAKVDGMLFDLGISSFQLDDPGRGFSFKASGPLDMRMDQSSDITAKDLVNRLSERELADIIFNFGEERFSRRIARALLQYRQEKLFETADELERVIFASVPISYRRQKYTRLRAPSSFAYRG